MSQNNDLYMKIYNTMPCESYDDLKRKLESTRIRILFDTHTSALIKMTDFLGSGHFLYFFPVIVAVAMLTIFCVVDGLYWGLLFSLFFLAINFTGIQIKKLTWIAAVLGVVLFIAFQLPTWIIGIFVAVVAYGIAQSIWIKTTCEKMRLLFDQNEKVFIIAWIYKWIALTNEYGRMYKNNDKYTNSDIETIMSKS